jgi:hypothetical protein
VPVDAPDHAFLGPSIDVTVTAGQKVVVMASKAMGSTAVGGATHLSLYICALSNVPGSDFTFLGIGIDGLTVAQNQRHTFGLSGVLTGLAPGTYAVGMCGVVQTGGSAANWNWNEYGYTTAFVTN